MRLIRVVWVSTLVLNGLLNNPVALAEDASQWFDSHPFSALLSLTEGAHPDGCLLFGLDRLSVQREKGEVIKHITLVPLQCDSSHENSTYEPTTSNQWPKSPGDLLVLENKAQSGSRLTVTHSENAMELKMEEGGAARYTLTEKKLVRFGASRELDAVEPRLDSDFAQVSQPYRVLQRILFAKWVCVDSAPECSLQLPDGKTLTSVALPTGTVPQSETKQAVLFWGFAVPGVQLSILE